MNAGSDWIKCDLHIHSPASFFHCYGDRNDPATWQRFLNDLEGLPTEFRIVGINDYLTIDGYKRVIAEKRAGRLSNIDCILPVVEFRLNRLVGEGKAKRLNYHAIFAADTVEPDMIQQQFLNALSATYQLEAGGKHPDWSGILSEDSLKDLGRRIKAQSLANASLQSKTDLQIGFDNFNVDFAALQKILSFTCFKDRVITAIGKTEWAEYRWDGGGAADKRTIINQTDVVFVASESVERYGASRQGLQSENVNARLLDCSDAHYFSDSPEKDRIGNCFTWIKAEPTFDGLRQILFEPGRISISESHPNKKAPYQVISRLRFVGGGDRFGNQEIRLSPDLNAIIGGKSTGKSLLAGLIVKSADVLEYQRRIQQNVGDTTDRLSWLEKELPAMNFQVIWQDGTVTTLKNAEQKMRKVTYFPQHYLNSNINDQGVGNKELNKIIRGVLAQKDLYAQAFDAYREQLHSLGEEIAASATSFEEALKDLRDARLRSSERGKSTDVRSNISTLEDQLGELQRKFNLDETEIALHSQLTAQRNTLNVEVELVSGDVSALSAITRDTLSVRISADDVLSDLSEAASSETVTAALEVVSPLVEPFITKVLEALMPLRGALESSVLAKDTAMAQVAKRLQPILEKIASSAPLREMAALLETEREKLAAVLIIEEDIAGLEGKIGTLAGELCGFIERRLSLAADVTAIMSEHPVEKGDELLKVDIRPFVKSKHVQATLAERIRYQSNADIRSIVQEPHFADSDFDTYRQAIATLVRQAVTGVLDFKSSYKLGGLLQELLSNGIYLNYDLKLGGDSFSIMSPGKRALALLRIIIELDASEHPIILDQPEDDLDNRSIYEGLAAYLKAKKARRQIIVVTHNPNVVVGADSEYVIVANQSGQGSNSDNEHYRFEYVYGGLERSFFKANHQWILHRQGIREHVCQILDGGKGAFQRREQLYATLRE